MSLEFADSGAFCPIISMWAPGGMKKDFYYAGKPCTHKRPYLCVVRNHKESVSVSINICP